ncbi:MAG: penicillin-binding protein 2 [Fimbriimonadales bacterium]
MGSSRSTVDRSRRLLVNRLLGLAMLGAFGSQAWVQVFHAQATIDRAKETKRFVGERREVAKRGSILSADGIPLAKDEDRYLLGLSFAKIPKSPAFFVALGSATGLSASEIANLADSESRFKEWNREVTKEQADRIREVQSDWHADGISLARPSTRAYPLEEAAANLVGYVREQEGGVAGIESKYENRLAGKDGQTVGLRDRNGDFLPMRMDPSSTAKRDGEDVVLTVDSDIQLAAYLACKRVAAENLAETASAVVMDPKTGDVLAMATWPSFNPNDLTGFRGADEKRLFRNTAVTDRFEPGSTFKILTLAMALDSKAWGVNQIYTCTGSKTIGKKTFTCDRDHNGGIHGPVDPRHAIAESCNVSAAEWALKIGYEPFLTYMKRFGLLNEPGLGLPAEESALFSREKVATNLQLATLGFGQSLSVSPAALADAFAAIGNGGLRMKPRIIKRIGSQEMPIEAAGQVVSKEAADTVIDYMQDVFDQDYGTGHKLRIPGYEMAGKTGTAQKQNRRGFGYVSNFVGFVPAKEPKAMILVMVDKPKKAFYGGLVAGPIFRDIAKAVIRRYDLRPDAQRVNP